MRSAALSLLIFLMPLAGWAQFNEQSAKVTRELYPDPDIQINTPAFQKEKGFTTLAEMEAFLEKIRLQNPKRMTVKSIGQSQKGRTIWMVTLTDGLPTTKTKVWMQGGLHGDEPGGTEAMLMLIERLIGDAALASTWQNLEIGIVPMANPDGYEAGNRVSANGIDLNRDQTRLRAPESVALKQAFNAFSPAVALDFHEYRPFRKDYTRLSRDGIAGFYDAQFLYTGNLNVAPGLRELTKKAFVDSAAHALDRLGLSHHDYCTPQKYGGRVEFNQGSVHSRSSATSYALTGAVSTLLEIRGVGLGRTSFKRRVHTSYQIALSYLRSAQAHLYDLGKLVPQAAIASYPVVVTSERKSGKANLTVLDLASGKPTRMEFIIHNALESTPTLTRRLPDAYLLMPDQKRAVRNLRTLGLKVDSLVKEMSLSVEALTLGKLPVADTATAADEEEAASTTTAPSTGTRTVVRTFPKGTWVVALQQPRSNLALETLEPENPNGFLSGGVIRLRDGDEFPVYRFFEEEVKPPAPSPLRP